jgi:uncharacterized protein YqeY
MKSTFKFVITDIQWDMEAMREDLAQYYENDNREFLDEKVKEELEILPKEYTLYEEMPLEGWDDDGYVIEKLHNHLHQFVPHPIKDFIAIRKI